MSLEPYKPSRSPTDVLTSQIQIGKKNSKVIDHEKTNSSLSNTTQQTQTPKSASSSSQNTSSVDSSSSASSSSSAVSSNSISTKNNSTSNLESNKTVSKNLNAKSTDTKNTEAKSADSRNIDKKVNFSNQPELRQAATVLSNTPVTRQQLNHWIKQFPSLVTSLQQSADIQNQTFNAENFLSKNTLYLTEIITSKNKQWVLTLQPSTKGSFTTGKNIFIDDLSPNNSGGNTNKSFSSNSLQSIPQKSNGGFPSQTNNNDSSPQKMTTSLLERSLAALVNTVKDKTTDTSQLNSTPQTTGLLKSLTNSTLSVQIASEFSPSKIGTVTASSIASSSQHQFLSKHLNLAEGLEPNITNQQLLNAKNQTTSKQGFDETSLTSDNLNNSKKNNALLSNKISPIYLAEINHNSKSLITASKTPLTIGQQVLLTPRASDNLNASSQLKGITAHPITPNALLSINKSSDIKQFNLQTENSPLPDAVNQQLKNTLPKQAPISQLLNFLTEKNLNSNSQLQSLLNNIESSNGIETKRMIELLQKLQSSFISKESFNKDSISKENISAEFIKKHLINSGVLLENSVEKLLQAQLISSLESTALENSLLENPALKNTAKIPSDIKALLLILKSFLDTGLSNNKTAHREIEKNAAHEKLLQHINQTLAKVQYNQTQSVLESHAKATDATQPFNHLFFDLPLKWQNTFLPLSIEIWQDERNDGEEQDKKQRVWQVKLDFELPDQTSFSALVKAKSSNNENNNEHVELFFWTSSDAFKKRLAQDAKQLSKKLEDKGINVDTINIARGKPPRDVKPFNLSLIDITT